MTLLYFGLLLANVTLLATSSYCINWHIELEDLRVYDPCVVKCSDSLFSGLIGYIGYPISLIGTIVSVLLLFR